MQDDASRVCTYFDSSMTKCWLKARLYQNMVKKIENISHLRNLTVLDLSFNKIRSTEPLAACAFEYLENLYLSSNKIVDVEGIFHLTQLKMLELGSNRIRAIPEQVSSLVNLKELWLGKNKICLCHPYLPCDISACKTIGWSLGSLRFFTILLA